MAISIQFQYMPDEKRRPIDGADHNEPIDGAASEFLAIPDVGDTVSYVSYEYEYDDKHNIVEGSGRTITVARKVKTRHFDYSRPDHVFVNIVVVDVPKGEMPMRRKE
jgi:hypothetical protein